jgi:Fur family ferric uptake transcriptional regulator
MEHIEDAELLRQQGHRLTPQRLQVLQAVKQHGQHVSAEAIHAAILPQQPYLSIATVYRTLQWLESVGLVAPISGGDGKLYFEYHPRGAHHHHLVCQACGQQIEIPDEIFAALRVELCERYGFTLAIDHLALPGQCTHCRSADV